MSFNKMNLYRREYRIYGRVQGVGFRYAVTWLARTYGLTGWVRNEYDGSVTVVLQGKNKSDFDCILTGLDRDRYIRIDEVEYRDIPPEEEEKTFSVRR